MQSCHKSKREGEKLGVARQLRSGAQLTKKRGSGAVQMSTVGRVPSAEQRMVPHGSQSVHRDQCMRSVAAYWQPHSFLNLSMSSTSSVLPR